MYSRYYGNHSSRPVKLPENYSGCAFSDAPQTEPLPHPLPVPLREPPPVKKPTEAPHPPISQAEACMDAKEAHTAEALPAPSYTNREEKSPLPFSLFQGWDFDRLLILGLLLLLLNNGEDSEIVLWLLLLLFC